MRKYIKNFKVTNNTPLGKLYGLLKMTPIDGEMPDMLPGQFVQVYIENCRNTYLRRPISINFVDKNKNELWLLIRNAGEGTNHLLQAQCGDILNLILPLGNGFSIKPGKILLIGGGVGVAPLLLLGEKLHEHGSSVSYLIGAKSKNDLLQIDEFAKYGNIYLSTEDGSIGNKGFVTQNEILQSDFDFIQCCGPLPMMKAVAKIAHERHIGCEVSLENMMACGVGACLCCVEDTVSGGNVCVCKNGPVFNINDLKWEI